ncbi:MAG: TonB-dependent receptor [Bacteroidaceae bacterium]
MKENKKTLTSAIRFRQYAHKSYSVFSSLKKEVSIGVVSFCVLTFANVQNISAQTANPNQTREYKLDEVEVTALRAPLALSRTARTVVVLDRTAIAAAPAQSINDLLKYAIGVDVCQRGVQGTQTDISIRGGSFDQITILLNGINICDPQTGHNSADFPVDMNDIERIEILEGPAARVYGTSSFLGAINIVTRTDKKSQAEVHTSGGSYGTFSAGARLNFTKNDLSNQISGNIYRSDGYNRSTDGKLNSNYNMQRAFYQGEYKHPKVNVHWQAGFSNKNYGSNTFYSALYDNQFEHTRKYFTSIQAKTEGVFHFTPSIYWTHGEDRFELIKGSESYVPYNYHKTNVYGLNISGYFNSILGKTTIGSEMRNEDLISTNLGEALHTPKHIHGTNRSYTYGLNRTNINYFIEHIVQLRHFTLYGGITATKNTEREDGLKIYPGADLNYQPTNAWKFYASWNTSFRMPTPTELYYSSKTNLGNKDLEPEKMQAFEVGTKYQTPGIQVRADVYYHHGKNMIDWMQAEGESVWKAINLSYIKSTGAELSFTLNFNQMMNEQVFIRRFYAGYNYIHQNKETSDNYVSEYALDYLRNKVVVLLDHRIWNRLTASWAFRWEDRIGSYKKYVNKKEVGIVNYNPYGLLDLKLNWSAPKYKLFVEANNLLDKTYCDQGNVPQPGIWVNAGISWKIF